MLAAAVIRARQSQRFATEQRYGFRFHLADIARGHFGIGKVGLIAMAEQLMAELMEKGFTGGSCNRVDGNFPAPLRVALSVAIEVFERNTLDL